MIQRIRKQDEFQKETTKKRQRCRASISLPSPDGSSSTLFKCNQAHISTSEMHVEIGRLKRKDGKVFSYSLVWEEQEDRAHETWRDEAAPIISIQRDVLTVPNSSTNLFSLIGAEKSDDPNADQR